MAKLHNYYILCPLIDQKSFLGVAQDKEAEHVIITLGRNVVNKHRLSDQKQVSGWTSKDHITSPVIYDKEQDNYVGVFNNNTIKMWNDDCTNLDKLKKYKFPVNIHKLIVREDQPPLIIFTNGNCASLPYAITNRNESTSLLKDTDEIIDIAWYKLENTDHVCYILKTKEGHEIVYCPIRDELGDLEKSKLSRVKISREENVKLVGQLICVKETHNVYVLWSDSKMHCYNMYTKKWRPLGKVPWISTRSHVSMTWMGKNHLVMFGSNTEQDGAILIAYNYILHVGSCKYPMKMYREKSKLYVYDSHIFLEASNHIGMLPFTLEINRNLSSLLGSHDIVQNESTHIADWDTPVKPMFGFIPEMKDSIKLGISERSACAQAMPDLLAKNDIKKVICVVREFKDVPESVIALLVRHAIKQINKNDQDAETYKPLRDISFEDHQDEFELLNETFKILFCDALLIPHLRNNLTVSESLLLMRYIVHLLFDTDSELDSDYESRLYDWCTLILDAFYQQYVLSKHPSVMNTLRHLQDRLSVLIKQLSSVSNTIAELHKLLAGTGASSYEDERYLPYTIEIMQI